MKFWNAPVPELLTQLQSSELGLTTRDAETRLKSAKHLKSENPFRREVSMLARQFASPLVLILAVAVVLSSILGEFADSSIIIVIILLTGIVGYLQERRASAATRKLLEMVQTKATVLREGSFVDIPIHEVVPGDIVDLNAGDIIPGDGRLLVENDLHVNEASLTGESFPQEKEVAELPEETPLNKRTNCVFQGSSVINGSARMLVVVTGPATEFGSIAASLSRQAPETAFETGIRKFGYLLMQVTLIIALLITALNVYLGKPFTDSFLFGLSIALGMTPELLPAIVTITLSAGAHRMAQKKVIVKKLNAIQNFGSIDVFCADKTGTLTEGVVRVESLVDFEGKPSDRVKTYAYLNAAFESGFSNPIDEALRQLKTSGLIDKEVDSYTKVDEVPYDFIRKRLSIVVNEGSRKVMITKGAFNNVIEVCTKVDVGGRPEELPQYRTPVDRVYQDNSAEGLRTIAIAYKDVTDDPLINKDDEHDMVFLGFIALADPPKKGIDRSIRALAESGITVKLITGDNALVAAHLSKKIGLDSPTVITGGQLKQLSDEALVQRVPDVNVFAETEPNQKERIIRALRKSGAVVGYIGDGINDVSAMKSADVSISVDGAVDVAKETADIVLLEKDLDILKEGIDEGRKTFANTMKYVFITSSANFGNMFSMAIASVFLPFLPLLPTQILLTNFLTDLPAMALPHDRVESERIQKPARWNTKSIRNFMIVFGLESSIFDVVTFVTLLWVFHSTPDLFRTGWFIESVATEVMILLIIRTHLPVWKSVPGRGLMITSTIVLAITFLLPYLPLADDLGLRPLTAEVALALVAITTVYCVTAEFSKQAFFKKLSS